VVKDRIGVRDSFIGPAKPKHLRIKKQKYVPTKELSPEQQEKRRRRNLMYHHRVRQATMSWTNMNLIEEFYQQAQILTKKNWDKARSRPYCSFEGKNCVWPSCTG
jgi:CRISPR/Cas system-associated protein Csx1